VNGQGRSKGGKGVPRPRVGFPIPTHKLRNTQNLSRHTGRIFIRGTGGTECGSITPGQKYLICCEREAMIFVTQWQRGIHQRPLWAVTILAIRPGRPWPTQTRAWPTQTKFWPTLACGQCLALSNYSNVAHSQSRPTLQNNGITILQQQETVILYFCFITSGVIQYNWMIQFRILSILLAWPSVTLCLVMMDWCHRWYAVGVPAVPLHDCCSA